MFWALRGGGAGSWGVITSITMRTYPTFSATELVTNIFFNSTTQAAAAMTIHAQHIFDLDALRAGQYFYLYNAGNGTSLLQMKTFFANVSSDDAQAALAPFIKDVQTVGSTFVNQTVTTGVANDIVGSADDMAGYNILMASRLFPATLYEENPEAIGALYEALLDQGAELYVLQYC